MNIVLTKNARLEKKCAELEREGAKLRRHVESAGGAHSEVQDNIATAHSELLKFKQKHRELMKNKKDTD